MHCSGENVCIVSWTWLFISQNKCEMLSHQFLAINKCSDCRRVPEIHIVQKWKSWFQDWHPVTNCTERTRRYSFIEDQLHHLIKTLILHLNRNLSFLIHTAHAHLGFYKSNLNTASDPLTWLYLFGFIYLALFTFHCLLWFQLLGALLWLHVSETVTLSARLHFNTAQTLTVIFLLLLKQLLRNRLCSEKLNEVRSDRLSPSLSRLHTNNEQQENLPSGPWAAHRGRMASLTGINYCMRVRAWHCLGGHQINKNM